LYRQLGLWLRTRWLEYRFGYYYVGFVVALYQIVVFTALFFGIRKSDLPFLILVTGIPFVLITWAVGLFHKLYQQETDVMVSYRVQFIEIEKIVRKVVREELAKVG
jgi:hypothetical protein